MRLRTAYVGLCLAATVGPPESVAAPLAQTANWTAEGDQGNSFFGLSVASAGDVNGDGYSDVIVGAPLYNNFGVSGGRIFVYYGSGMGLGAAPAWSLGSFTTGALFGWSVATAGDVNGDGYSDVIVGAPGSPGRALVYFGSAAGLNENNVWTAQSNQSQDDFGLTVATAGDVDGNGFDDIIVGAPSYDEIDTADVGYVFVWLGSASGLGPDGTPANADWSALGSQVDAEFGFAVGTAGDVNGDGFDEVIVGAPRFDTPAVDNGRAFVWYGSASGLGSGGSPANADWVGSISQAGAQNGYSVGTAGDVNGDGFDDVIVGVPFFTVFGASQAGAALVYLGSATGLSPSPNWSAQGNQAGGHLGISVSSAGDVDGDGYGDVVVGANLYDNGQDGEGRVFGWLGSPAGLGSNGTVFNADWSAEGDQAAAFFGESLGSAGDVNSDGYSDVIIGAWAYDGDIANEGKAFVYHGSIDPTLIQEPGPISRPRITPEASCCGGATGESSEWVSRFSGEFLHNQVDFAMPGRGPCFLFRRQSWSKLIPLPCSPSGVGWASSYDIRLMQDGADVLLLDGAGRVDRYVNQGNGTYLAPQFFRELMLEQDGTYTLTFEDTGKFTFRPFDGSASQGRINSITDRNGNTISFAYNALGLPSTITDTLGRAVTLTYNAQMLLTSVTDWAGRQTVYEYYQAGESGGSLFDLKCVRTPIVTGTPNANNFPQGKTTKYTYTTGFADPRLNHDILTIIDGKEQTYLQNVYAHTVSASDPRYTTDPTNLNFDRVVRQVIGDAGDIIDYLYTAQTPSSDNNFAVIKVTVNDRVGNVTEQFYDAQNREVIVREYTGRADPDSLTNLDADPPINPPLNPLRPDDPPFFETRYEYNDDALVTHIIHPNGNEETLVYDSSNPDPRAHGNLLQHCWLPGPLGGDQAQVCESFEYVTGFGGCCGTNFVKKHTDARGNITMHTYDPVGNRVHTTHRIPSIVEDWEYNALGQMTAHILPDNGSAHRRRDEYTYYTTGLQTGYLHQRITDAGGFALTTTYEYDSVGNVVRMIDPRGHDALYTRNALDQVVRETSREVTDGSGVRYQRDIWYDRNNNVVRVDVQNLDDAGAVQPNSHFTTVYEYETLNNITRMCQESGSFTGAIPGTHDAPMCTGLPQAEFVVTEYGYDANRNRTLVRKGEAVSGNQPTNTVTTLYDERDLVFRTLRAAGAPGPGGQSSTQHDYDGNGNLKAIRAGLESSPRVTTMIYDGFERRVSTTDPMGNVSMVHYDANGNPVSTRVDGQLNDVAGSTDNVRLSETIFTYDPMDRRTLTSAAFFDPQTQAPIADGQSVTQTIFSDNSQVVQSTNDNGHVTLTSYDTANRRHIVTDPKANTVTFTYDANSNVISRVELEKSDLGNPNQSFTTILAYDNLDRLIQNTDNVGNVTAYAHDSRNNRVRMTDALGRQRRWAFDGLSRLTATIRDMNGNGASASDPGDIVTTQSWDDSSRLITQADDNGNATTYTYDALDRRTLTTDADGTTHLQTYDVHDNRLTANDPSGITIFLHDLLDRLTFANTLIVGAGFSAQDKIDLFSYDGLSRIISAINSSANISRAYDSLSHITRETLNGKMTQCVYDGVGNQTQCSYPGGRTINTTYDSLERKAVLSDADGMIATYSYVGPRRVERRDYGNGTRTTYQYDGITGVPNPVDDFGVKHIVRTTHSVISSGALIDDRTYTWDRVGNKTRRKDIRPGGPQWTYDYSYDASNRLVHTTVTDPSPFAIRDTGYQLDGVHNRTAVVGAPDSGPHVGSYTLEDGTPLFDYEMNQYTRIPRQARSYDGNGNLTSMSSSFADCMQGPGVAPPSAACSLFDLDLDEDVDLADFAIFQNMFEAPVFASTMLLYDTRNRLVEWHDARTGQRHTYRHDPFGRRIAKLVDADGVAGGPTETRYFYDGQQIVEEQTNTGVTSATYAYGLYIDEVLTMQRDVDGQGGPENYYYHTDDLYNVMVMTNDPGAAVERYEYGDYGRPRFLQLDGGPIPSGQSLIANSYLFTGRLLDPETGLYHYRTRYLDADSGRFTQRDKSGTWADGANVGNARDYVANNPMSTLDPMGMLSRRLGFDDLDELDCQVECMDNLGRVNPICYLICLACVDAGCPDDSAALQPEANSLVRRHDFKSSSSDKGGISMNARCPRSDGLSAPGGMLYKRNEDAYYACISAAQDANDACVDTCTEIEQIVNDLMGLDFSRTAALLGEACTDLCADVWASRSEQCREKYLD